MHRNVLTQSLERNDKEYEPSAICYSIIVYLNEVYGYRLFFVCTAPGGVKIATQTEPLGVKSVASKFINSKSPNEKTEKA